VLLVGAGLPVKSLDDLVQLARKTPKGLSYASTGVGSAQHLSTEFLKRELRIDMTHVPFRGPIPALTAVAGGHAELMFIDVLNATSLIEAGKVRPIALTTAVSLDVFRGVPTFAEAGLQGFDVDLRFVIFAPANTPAAIVARLNSNIRAATDDPAVRERFGKVGVEVKVTPGPEGVAAIYRDELDRWYRLVGDAGLAKTQ
jgi:tripartite-type tricarboxylate transporter receptor subunit TctC